MRDMQFKSLVVRNSTSRLPKSRRGPLLLLATMATLVSASCGGSSVAPSGASAHSTIEQSTTYDSSIMSLLPDSIKKSREVTLAVTPTSPPLNYLDIDGKTIIGQDADMMIALGKVLNVRFRLIDVGDYGSILSGVRAGRFDGGLAFADTKTREQVVDFVDFFYTGVVFVGRSGAEGTPCGKSVGMGQGSLADSVAKGISDRECVAKGKPGLAVKLFANSNDVTTALDSGRLDTILIDESLAGFMVEKSGGAYSILGRPYSRSPIGVAIQKSLPGLSSALKAGLQLLLANGVYNSILKKWGTGSTAAKAIEINAAGKG